MIRRLIAALDDRLGAAPFLRHALDKAFPDNWSFLLGEIALYSFIFLVGSGIFLTFFFVPSRQEVIYSGNFIPLQHVAMSEAYRSALNLSTSIPAGLLVRQAHHWAALIFVAAIVAHACRVFFSGAFRKPRELTWMAGVVLLMLALLAGFTGYSLPDDLLSGTGLRIAFSVALAIPFIGTYVAYALFGGDYPTQTMTHRLFVYHIWILPLAIAAVLGLHLFLVWRQKHTQFPGPGRTEGNVVGSPLWPNYALKSVGFACAVIAVIFGLAALFQINPIWVYGPYSASFVAAPAQPDWYLGWLEGALRLAPPAELHIFGKTISSLFFPTILMPLVFFSLMFAYPFIERFVKGDRRPHHLLEHGWETPWRTAVGWSALTFVGVLTFAGSDDVQAAYFGVPVQQLAQTYQVALWVFPIAALITAYLFARDWRNRELEPQPENVILLRTSSGGYEMQPAALGKRLEEAASKTIDEADVP